MTKNQKRVIKVLERLIEDVRENEEQADGLMEDLEIFLNGIHSMDGFGTEGQSDPRGDFRNGTWKMTRVEGIDK